MQVTRLLHRHRDAPLRIADVQGRRLGDLNRRMRRDILYSAQEREVGWLRNRPARQANSLIIGSGGSAARRLLRGILTS